VLFQVNHKKRNTLKSLLGVSALQLMLCFLAYIATLIFREFEDREEELQQWSPPESQKLSEKLKNVFRLDSFETRFALRMSVVLLVSFAYTMLSQADHGYWLPMNAFLLLRPMYEDSKYRMKTR